MDSIQIKEKIIEAIINKTYKISVNSYRKCMNGSIIKEGDVVVVLGNHYIFYLCEEMSKYKYQFTSIDKDGLKVGIIGQE
jgi:urease beta subunit